MQASEQEIGERSQHPTAIGIGSFINGYSIEVLPRTAAKIESFRQLLPLETRVYIANVDGTPLDEMVRTAKRLRGEGFAVMPHIPARFIRDIAEFEHWLRRYREEADVHEALVIGGDAAKPAGSIDSATQLFESGLFDKYGFTRLHVAGHPEGNANISRGGATRLDDALMWKQAFADQTDAKMAIVTQFFFDAEPVIAWIERLRNMGVTLPVHLGVAGPTRLQSLIRYALTCGVGPSVAVLKKRALDLSRLLMPYEPDDVLAALAGYAMENPGAGIEQVHFFPLGGIERTVGWLNSRISAEPVIEAP
jgi:methylenetetrahydrofolate reductase (NADPH)